MKLSILLAGSILTSAMVGNAYAQTCGAQPSCAELGYTLTSTSSCVGNVLKCPFDKTKYYCTQKSEVTTVVMPDYNQAFSRNCGTTYTADKDGYIFGSEAYWDNWSTCKQMSGYYIKIRGTNVRLTERIHGNYINNWIYPVKKGYSYFVSCANCRDGNYGEYYYKFVPLS